MKYRLVFRRASQYAASIIIKGWVKTMSENVESDEQTRRELAEILRIAIRLGALMLRSGAASFRTDQAVSRVALALGVERIECYVTPNIINATVYRGPEHRTQIAKIEALGVNMDRICALDLLARHVKHNATPAEVSAQIDAIEQKGLNYSQPTIIAAVGLACGAFALILGSGILEAVAATLAAFVAQWVRMRLATARINPLAITVVCAAIAATLSLALVRLFSAPAPRLAVIASVLLLVPGVPLVTSILDLTRFDLVSGVARGVYAGLIIISIGIGMLIALTLTGFSIL
jgi:uncharacterized membrane protein YjjP (DUF1212 family)